MEDQTELSFLRILMNDALVAMRRQASEDTQTSRRDLVRTLFASAEGLAWDYRIHVIAVAKDIDRLETSEELALSEKIHSVDERGVVHAQRRYISLLAAIRLCARITERLNPSLQLDFGDGGWDRFKAFVAIRNRLAHPKTVHDLTLSDGDVKVCTDAFFWFVELSADAMESANQAFQVHTKQFADIVDRLKKGDPEMLLLYQSALTHIEN